MNIELNPELPEESKAALLEIARSQQGIPSIEIDGDAYEVAGVYVNENSVKVTIEIKESDRA